MAPAMRGLQQALGSAEGRSQTVMTSSTGAAISTRSRLIAEDSDLLAHRQQHAPGRPQSEVMIKVSALTAAAVHL